MYVLWEESKVAINGSGVPDSRRSILSCHLVKAWYVIEYCVYDFVSVQSFGFFGVLHTKCNISCASIHKCWNLCQWNGCIHVTSKATRYREVFQ